MASDAGPICAVYVNTRANCRTVDDPFSVSDFTYPVNRPYSGIHLNNTEDQKQKTSFRVAESPAEIRISSLRKSDTYMS